MANCSSLRKLLILKGERISRGSAKLSRAFGTSSRDRFIECALSANILEPGKTTYVIKDDVVEVVELLDREHRALLDVCCYVLVYAYLATLRGKSIRSIFNLAQVVGTYCAETVKTLVETGYMLHEGEYIPVRERWEPLLRLEPFHRLMRFVACFYCFKSKRFLKFLAEEYPDYVKELLGGVAVASV